MKTSTSTENCLEICGRMHDIYLRLQKSNYELRPFSKFCRQIGQENSAQLMNYIDAGAKFKEGTLVTEDSSQVKRKYTQKKKTNGVSSGIKLVLDMIQAKLGTEASQQAIQEEEDYCIQTIKSQIPAEFKGDNYPILDKFCQDFHDNFGVSLKWLKDNEGEPFKNYMPSCDCNEIMDSYKKGEEFIFIVCDDLLPSQESENRHRSGQKDILLLKRISKYHYQKFAHPGCWNFFHWDDNASTRSIAGSCGRSISNFALMYGKIKNNHKSYCVSSDVFRGLASGSLHFSENRSKLRNVYWTEEIMQTGYRRRTDWTEEVHQYIINDKYLKKYIIGDISQKIPQNRIEVSAPCHS